MQEELFIGLISGTSMDGIDAVLASFSDRDCRIHASLCHPYPASLKNCLADATAVATTTGIEEFGTLHAAVAEEFANAVAALLKGAGTQADAITAIGSHGQTVLHAPRAGYSLQLGDPGRIAVRTGIITVGDFRSADIAAGGQGAPLVPAFHRWVFRAKKNCAVLNLGGIGNLTLLPTSGEITGFDTGPANTLLDQWVGRHLQEAFDHNGQWAAAGRVDESLLASLLAEPWFAEAPPKSTGRELFNLEWLQGHLAAAGTSPDPRDVQATLAELTAASIANALHDFAAQQPATIAICGGGAANSDLLARLARRLPGCRLQATDAWGLPADWVEASAFAWLARERLAGRPTNVPAVTGADRQLSLGGVYLPASGCLSR